MWEKRGEMGGKQKKKVKREREETDKLIRNNNLRIPNS